jgi:hypothetical protein
MQLIARILLFGIVFHIPPPCLAQYANKPNNYYLEVGGAGGWGSVNYERRFGADSKWGARFGVGYYGEQTTKALTIPVSMNYRIALRRDSIAFLEAGLGATYFGQKGYPFSGGNVEREGSFLRLVPTFGYRKNERNGLWWRLSAVLILGKETFAPWLGLAIGYRH